MTALPARRTSNRAAFRFPTPPMEATDERCVSGLMGDIQSEHDHRYLFALRFCVGSDVLDVACGEGCGSALLGQVAKSVIGVDADQSSVRFANNHYLSERVSFRRADATGLPIEDASVDVVVSFKTIEHVADHAAFLAQIRRVLRPGGVLVISSPDHAVYSKETSHNNPFHVKKLGRAEFLALMRENFPNVVLLEQRALHGSVILRADETGTEAPLEGFDTPDGTLFERSAGVPAAPYLIAVCAMGEPPLVPGSVMNTPRPLWHVEEMRQRAEAARDNLEAELSRITALAAERSTAVEDLSRRLDDAEATGNKLSAELSRVVDLAAERGTAAEDLSGRLVEAESARAKLAAELSRITASAAHHGTAVESLSRRLREAESARDNASAELSRVVESTSWRIMAPLRALMTRWPGPARFGRRVLKIGWWTVTGQLPSRLRARRAAGAQPGASGHPAPEAPAGPLFDLAAVADGQKEWATYAPMKARLEGQESARIAAAKPRPIPLVEVSDGELETALAGLSLPEFDAPVVSILVPAFNNVRLTAECLLSIRQHTDGTIPYEVILVDDGSTDRTQELLSRVPGLVYRRNDTNLHFLRSCNGGAEAARGEFLVLIHNDAQVTAGWLAPLLAIFHAEPRCGAAGPRILYPSGYLQEAGIRIEPDATTTMLGLYDDPTHARYSFSRRVDYCSGVALMFRRETWKALGGFDTNLAPAHCEDMEICLRLRDAGQDVWYVADSTVVHHLSGTIAAEGNEGKQRQVVANQQKVAERWQPQIDSLNEVRLFAFYLPQFHPIPENDRWWGRGFTEWTNVARAVPQYPGHYQPQLPSTLGFYDLRLPEVLEAQAALARCYGIEGFCFYYYWFAGKRLLEQPIEAMLASGKPEFPFFLCWANENWSRRWDGQDAELLIMQHHSPDDDEAVIRDLLRYMQDSRYVRVRGRPLLLVYRVDLLPDFAATARRWREVCRAEGLGEIFLAGVESFQLGHTSDMLVRFGLDASVSFPPHGHAVPADTVRATAHPRYAGQIYDYEASAANFAAEPFPSWPRFPTVIPAWDNTARRMEAGTVFDGATPGAFEAWLEAAIEQSRAHNAPGERVVFINAWNEWAEGAQIEPDRVFGHARLEAVRAAQRHRFLGRPWSA